MNKPVPSTMPAATLAPRVAEPHTERGALSLQIDRVVLDGLVLGARDRARFQVALQAELAQLLSVQGPNAALLGGTALPELRADDLRCELSRDADRLGRVIAQSLHARIV